MRARQAARVHLQLVPGRGRRRPHALLHLARRRRARVRWAPAALQCARRPSGLPCLFALVSPLLKRPDPAQGPACLQAAQRHPSKREAHSAKRPCGHAQNALCGSARAPQRAHPAAGQAARVRARRDRPARRRPAGELRGPGGARAGRAAGRRAAEHARGLARRSGRADGRGRAGAGELWRRGCLRPLPWPARRAGGRRGARGHVHAGAGAPHTPSPNPIQASFGAVVACARFHGPRAALVGDAVHAVTSTLGEGAAQKPSPELTLHCFHGPRAALVGDDAHAVTSTLGQARPRGAAPRCPRACVCAGGRPLTTSHRPWLRLML